jgi:hypothetical protein
MFGRAVKWATWTCATLLVIQIIRPARTNPPIDPAKTVASTSHVPPDVAATLDRACKDCHTTGTSWPWYSNVAPISWFVINHVDDGRRALLLSDWADIEPARKMKRLGDICKEVRDGDMPLTSYLWMHADARLSEADVTAICQWTDAERATR